MKRVSDSVLIVYKQVLINDQIRIQVENPDSNPTKKRLGSDRIQMRTGTSSQKFKTLQTALPPMANWYIKK
jgi:hypothetical protein